MCSASSATTPRRPGGKKSRHEARRRRRGEAHQRDRHHHPPARDAARHRRRTVTADALLTQRALAKYLLGRGADYLFTVKGNQPTLQDDIGLLLDEIIARRAPDFTDEGAKPEHGRQERRSIWVSSELNEYLNFPGVGQVFAVRRETVEVKSAKRRCETAYGVTSLTAQAASPERLLTLNRGHWTIEATHHILDWSFDEDRSRIRTGHGPENMTRLRRFAIGLIKGARARRRPDHAQSGQEPAPRPRLPENARQRRPAAAARLTAPPGRGQRLVANPRDTRGERSCPDDAVVASRVQGNRYRAARWRPNPAPSRCKNANESSWPRSECCEPARKLRTNLPCQPGPVESHGRLTSRSRLRVVSGEPIDAFLCRERLLPELFDRVRDPAT